jgi:hypothetical protein
VSIAQSSEIVMDEFTVPAKDDSSAPKAGAAMAYDGTHPKVRSTRTRGLQEEVLLLLVLGMFQSAMDRICRE